MHSRYFHYYKEMRKPAKNANNQRFRIESFMAAMKTIYENECYDHFGAPDRLSLAGFSVLQPSVFSLQWPVLRRLIARLGYLSWAC